MKTKYISLFFSFVIAFGMMSCSSEIPNGDTSKFSDLKSPEEDMVKKDYLPLKHPCMLHTETDFEFVKGKVQAGAQPWKNTLNWKQAIMRKVLIQKKRVLCLMDI